MVLKSICVNKSFSVRLLAFLASLLLVKGERRMISYLIRAWLFFLFKICIPGESERVSEYVSG